MSDAAKAPASQAGARGAETPVTSVSPTVFTGVEHAMRISQEEIFGPVAAVIRFKDDEEALRLANGTSYSLAAGVWSADIARVHRFARNLKAGTVWVNTFRDPT